jgi:hypothetical protein
VVRYQPWGLDNTKIFYVVWIPFAVPLVSQYLLTFWKSRKIYFMVLLFATVFSSLLHLNQFFFFPCPIYERTDYKFGLWVAENTPLNVVFMSTGFTGDPVAPLAGRQLYLGYPGWIDSHGLHWQDRWEIVERIVKNPNDRDLIEKQGIDYVVDCAYGKRRTYLHNTSKSVWKRVYSSSSFNAWRYVPKVWTENRSRRVSSNSSRMRRLRESG